MIPIYYIPFLYFSLLLVLLWYKFRNINLPIYILLIYDVSALFAILREEEGIRTFSTTNYEISLEATIVYCVLLSICLIPLIKYTANKTQIVLTGNMINKKMIRYVAIFSFLYFLVILIFNISSIVNILSSDMGELRQAVYDGNSRYRLNSNMPYLLSLILVIPNYILGNSYLLIFFAFLAYIFKLERKYVYMLLAASLCQPLQGIIGIDRSKMTYWILAFGACFVVFKKYITFKDNKRLYITLSALFGIIILYLITLTDSRWGEKDGGSLQGIIAYLGEPYINFTFFYDKYSVPEINLQKIFPFTYRIFFSDVTGGLEYNNIIALKTGLFVSVFYTFIGDIIISCGTEVAILYCFIYVLLSITILKKTLLSKQSNIIVYYYLLYVVGSVMFLGLFAYFYSEGIRTFSTIALYFIVKKMAVSNDGQNTPKHTEYTC